MKATPSEQRWAQMVASMITMHRNLWQRAARVKLGEIDEERFFELQSQRSNVIGFYICYVCNFPDVNPARFLRLVAAALDGSLRGAPHDEVIQKAYKKTVRTGKRKGKGNMEVFDLFADVGEVLDSYAKLTKPGERRSERQVRRRLEAMKLLPDRATQADIRSWRHRKRKQK